MAKKHKITSSERSVLEQLVFPETFDKLREETDQSLGELRDNLINLINFGFVEAFENGGRHISSAGFYDADNLQDFTFRATSKGLSAI